MNEIKVGEWVRFTYCDGDYDQVLIGKISRFGNVSKEVKAIHIKANYHNVLYEFDDFNDEIDNIKTSHNLTDLLKIGDKIHAKIDNIDGTIEKFDCDIYLFISYNGLHIKHINKSQLFWLSNENITAIELVENRQMQKLEVTT